LITNVQNLEVVVSQLGLLLMVELLHLELWNIQATVNDNWMVGTVSGKELTQLLPNTCRWALLQSRAAKVEDKKSWPNTFYSSSNYYQISAGNCQKGESGFICLEQRRWIKGSLDPQLKEKACSIVIEWIHGEIQPSPNTLEGQDPMQQKQWYKLPGSI
jgi:hypothetical protein